jgi:Ca-activated chloride channel family protein
MLIRPNESFRHVDFRIEVGAVKREASQRLPLRLALVVDRSGSMQGRKLDLAKHSVRAVVERLDERDQVALVVFDHDIEILQRLAPASGAVKAGLAEALLGVEARGATALHEGWLAGCHEVAALSVAADGAVARCFLLTDGLANRGLTDPEAIATQAADVLANAGVGTSTFGIGDYDEQVLGPMAVAGSGQFHHLRTPEDIAHAFVRELGEMLSVAARRVRLEIEVEAGVRVEVVSDYHATHAGERSRWGLPVGDLLPGEVRHVVVRFGFPPGALQERRAVRSRVVWMAEDGERRTEWQEVAFTYAGHSACDAEQYDPMVMHWVGLHHASRAQMEAWELYTKGDAYGARHRLRSVARRIERYAGGDAELLQALRRLDQAEHDLQDRERSRENVYKERLISRGQRDLRGPAESR